MASTQSVQKTAATTRMNLAMFVGRRYALQSCFFDFEEGYCLICGSNSRRRLVEKAGCFELGCVGELIYLSAVVQGPI